MIHYELFEHSFNTLRASQDRTMGKSGKHRKRVRMLREHERAAAVLNSGGGSAGGASSNDGVQRQAGVDASARDDGEEGDDDGEVDYAGGILPEDLATTVATLHTIGHNTELLKLKDFKALRGALHPVRADVRLAIRTLNPTPSPPLPLTPVFVVWSVARSWSTHATMSPNSIASHA